MMKRKETAEKRNPDNRREYDMPEPIPDTPENVAKAILSTPPKKEGEWEYLKESPKSK